MIVGALNDVGGRAYLARQAEKNPNAFMALVGRVLPLNIAGTDGGPVMIITVAPGQGFAGRPSSDRLIKAALKR